MIKQLRIFATLLLLAVCGGMNATEETFNFVGWNFDGASKWTSAYAKQTVNGTAATVVFDSADKQASTVTDCPVTKGSPITVTLKDNSNTITAVDIVLKQWTNKAQTVTLNTSTDGSTFSATSSTSATFSLSATGLSAKAVKFTFSSSANQVGIQSIKITYSSGDTRTPVTLGFETPAGFKYLQGEVPATVTNPATLTPSVAGAAISYESSNTAVAEVAADGTVTLKDVPGIANITAKFAGDDNYTSASATYPIEVVGVVSSIADLTAALNGGKTTDMLVRFNNAQVTYVNANRTYIQDATGGILIYGTGLVSYTQGQILNGTATVKGTVYNKLPEITAFSAGSDLKVTEGTSVPTEISTADAANDANISKYVILKDVNVEAGLFDANGTDVLLYDTYKFGFPNDGKNNITMSGTYDIVAIPTVFNTTKELAVISMAVKQTVGEVGYATSYYSNLAFTVPEGVSAYTYQLAGDVLTVSTEYAAGDVIPAGEAVVLKADAGTYSFVVAPGNTNQVDANNKLLGTDEETILDEDASSYFYGLSLNAAGDPASVGFYWMEPDGDFFINGAHKAYLKLAKAAAAKTAFLLNGTTGINAIETADEAQFDENAPIYNLAGQRVSRNYSGVVIQNGKKFMNR